MDSLDYKENGLHGMVGTAHYIAPEVIKGHYDEKCDIWALGIIAYQLFSTDHELPFTGENEVQIYKAIRKGKFYLPSLPKNI